MANLIQIKRSTTTAAPVSLSAGELAWTSNGDVLYIGSNTTTVTAIAGKRFPGVLTANQALVANATSGIDKIIVANLVSSFIYANGAFGTTDQVLSSNSTGGVYWKSVATGGVSSVATGAGLTGGPITSSGTVSVLANNGITANATGLYVTAANGISVTATGVNVLAGNTQLFANSTGLWANQAQFNHDALTNFVANKHIDHTAVTLTAGAGLTGGGDISASRTFTVGAGVGITVNADDVAVNANTLSGLVANATGVHIKTGVGVSFDGSGNVAIGQAVGTTSSVTFANVVTTDCTVSGNLTVSGTLITVDATNLVVNDSIISLARNNGANALDIGFYGQYNNGTERFTGLVWDTSASVYELFANTTVEPTTTVDTAAIGYTRATLKSFLDTGALVSNLTHVAITANATVNVSLVANSLSLTTALPATSGGTGLNTYTSGDLLVANTGNVLSKLGIGTDGYVLQVSGTSVTWNSLDGGTF